jgi:hypothetical protein
LPSLTGSLVRQADLELDSGSAFAKVNLKDHREIVLLNASPSFEAELAVLRDVKVRRDL